MTQYTLERLKNIFIDFAECESNLLSKMTLSVKHLHATIHIKFQNLQWSYTIYLVKKDLCVHHQKIFASKKQEPYLKRG